HADDREGHRDDDEHLSVACHGHSPHQATAVDSFLTAAANINKAQPYSTRSMPTARPMNHMPDAGHWISSITPSTTDTRPDATLHPQLGNCSIADPNVLNSPPATK